MIERRVWRRRGRNHLNNTTSVKCSGSDVMARTSVLSGPIACVDNVIADRSGRVNCEGVDSAQIQPNVAKLN